CWPLRLHAGPVAGDGRTRERARRTGARLPADHASGDAFPRASDGAGTPPSDHRPGPAADRQRRRMSDPLPVFAYAFAKHQGMLLLLLGERARVGLREDADPVALLEARRSVGVELDVEVLPRASFDRRL